MTMTKNRYNPYEFDKSNENIQNKMTPGIYIKLRNPPLQGLL